MKRLLWGLLIAAVSLVTTVRAAEPKHLVAAADLVAHLRLENTSYGHGEPQLIWQGHCQSHADCSGFVDALLTHSYGYSKDDFKRWFDSHQPSARRYYDAIVAGRGFDRVQRLAEVQPGDILAVKYFKRTDNTGHVMLVGRSAAPHHAHAAYCGGHRPVGSTRHRQFAHRPRPDRHPPSPGTRRQGPRRFGTRRLADVQWQARSGCRFLLEHKQSLQVRRSCRRGVGDRTAEDGHRRALGVSAAPGLAPNSGRRFLRPVDPRVLPADLARTSHTGQPSNRLFSGSQSRSRPWGPSRESDLTETMRAIRFCTGVSDTLAA